MDPVDPLVTAEEAENIAWQEDGSTPDAKAQQAQLSLMPAGGNFPVDTLVWDIHYTGACIQPSIVLSWPKDLPRPGCTNTTSDTVIDANTGEFIYGYTDG